MSVPTCSKATTTGDLARAGWYKRGTFGRWQPDEPYTEPLVRAQLDIGTANTWQTVCRTDTAWRAALSGYRDTGSWNALDFGGEEIDARRNPRSMSSLRPGRAGMAAGNRRPGSPGTGRRRKWSSPTASRSG